MTKKLQQGIPDEDVREQVGFNATHAGGYHQRVWWSQEIIMENKPLIRVAIYVWQMALPWKLMNYDLCLQVYIWNIYAHYCCNKEYEKDNTSICLTVNDSRTLLVSMGCACVSTQQNARVWGPCSCARMNTWSTCWLGVRRVLMTNSVEKWTSGPLCRQPQWQEAALPIMETNTPTTLEVNCCVFLASPPGKLLCNLPAGVLSSRAMTFSLFCCCI